MKFGFLSIFLGFLTITKILLLNELCCFEKNGYFFEIIYYLFDK